MNDKHHPRYETTHSEETRLKISNSMKNKRIGKNHPLAKKWFIVDPNGNEFKIIGGFETFCKTHSIKSRALLVDVALGKREHYNGWKARYL